MTSHSGVPTPHWDLLEQLTGIRKTLYLTISFLLQLKDTNQNQPKGTMIEQGLEGSQRWSFCHPLAALSPEHIDVRQYTEYSQLESLLRLLVSRVFIQSPFPLGVVRTDMTCSRDPFINHNFRLSSSQSPQRKEDSPVSIQGLRNHLPVAKGKDKTSLWIKLVFHCIVSCKASYKPR